MAAKAVRLERLVMVVVVIVVVVASSMATNDGLKTE